MPRASNARYPFAWILTYAAAAATLSDTTLGAPSARNGTSLAGAATRHKRQISIDDLLSTALQLVRPIFDTGQPLPFDSAMIPKRVYAEQSTGVRESKILGAPAFSTLRDVPICRGNSQICQFISCTAHNFKYDQNLSNLNLAAQLINDRDFRKTISQNPETITTVCHEQGLSTNQCRIFSRAFQFIDRFMTSIQKSELGSEIGTGKKSETLDDDEDDGIIGGKRRNTLSANAVIVPGQMMMSSVGYVTVDPIRNMVFDDDGSNAKASTIATRDWPLVEFGAPREKFFATRQNAIIAEDAPHRESLSIGEKSNNDIFNYSGEIDNTNLSADNAVKIAGNLVAAKEPIITGSRTWSTHAKDAAKLNNTQFNRDDKNKDTDIGREYGWRTAMPPPNGTGSAPKRANPTRNSTRSHGLPQASFIGSSPMTPRINRIKEGGAASRQIATAHQKMYVARDTLTKSTAPHAVAPRPVAKSTVGWRVATIPRAPPRVVTARPASNGILAASRKPKLMVEDLSLSIDSMEIFDGDTAAKEPSKKISDIPEAEDAEWVVSYEESGDKTPSVVTIDPRTTRRRPKRADEDYYDDVRHRDRSQPTVGDTPESHRPQTEISGHEHPRQNCFQYLG